jgi:predicted MFS family arabinose efflux permease
MNQNPTVKLPRHMLAILALTQIISWGSIYYAFAIVSGDIGRELGLPPTVVFGGFSWSLLVAGVLATPIGIMLDRSGGRRVMGGGSICAALKLALLALAQSAWSYLFAWTVIGLSMALVMYEAAFATINREHPDGARRAISILTLFGGFASTLFWPLTLALNAHLGWRDTYLIYAGVHLLVCAPLHGLLPAGARPVRQAVHARASMTLHQALRHPMLWRLAAAFAANSFAFSALAVHLIPMLQRMGHSAQLAVAVAALMGPMQVAGRIGEMLFAKHARPQAVGMLTFSLLPVALLLLVFSGSDTWAIVGFCLLFGFGNGIMTIVRGTLPQALFGPENYGAIAGALAGPSLILKAAGPLAIAWVIGGHANTALPLTILWGVSVVSFACSLMWRLSACPSPPVSG